MLEQVSTGGPVTVSLVREVLGLAPEEGLLAVLEAAVEGAEAEVMLNAACLAQPPAPDCQT